MDDIVKIIEDVADNDSVWAIDRHGKPAVVVISAGRYATMVTRVRAAYESVGSLLDAIEVPKQDDPNEENDD